MTVFKTIAQSVSSRIGTLLNARSYCMQRLSAINYSADGKTDATVFNKLDDELEKKELGQVFSETYLNREQGVQNVTSSDEEQMSTRSIEKSRFLIVGNKQDDSLKKIALSITEHSSVVDTSCDLDSALDESKQNPSRWRTIFIHIPDREAISCIVEHLLTFRISAPAVPIVLISPTFGRDDFGMERAAIADISIREPVRLSWLEAYINMALINNQVWQAKQQEL